MGLSWQQGPLAPGAIGRFLVPEPLPERLLYIEPLRRRMRVRFGGAWIAESENVLLFFEPGRYPVAYFPQADVSPEVLERSEHITKHPDLGQTSWYLVKAGGQRAPRGAWQHVEVPRVCGRSWFANRVRLAGHGCLLRRRGTDFGPCCRQLPSN